MVPFVKERFEIEREKISNALFEKYRRKCDFLFCYDNLIVAGGVFEP